MNIAFRVDATHHIGSGHVMRCLTLANELRKHSHYVQFISRNLEGNLFEQIKKEGFGVRILPKMAEKIDDSLVHSSWLEVSYKTDAYQTLDVLDGEIVDMLIVDHYAIDYRWEKIVSKSVKKLFVIDDLADRKHYCNFLLDQNYYINMYDRYKHLVQPYTGCMIGPKYSLIRDEFLEEKEESKIPKETNILVFFGGADLTSETIKVISNLKSIEKKVEHVFVVVGKNNPDKELIKEFCDLNLKFQFHYDINYMAKLMKLSTFAICAGGSTTWERYCMGLPAIVIAVAPNQYEICERLENLGIDIFIGKSHSYKMDKLVECSEKLINSKEDLIARKKEEARKIVDGLGKKRIIEIIEKEVS